ncbi:ABC transporter permease, partial [Streptococcus pneumoniae]
MKEQLKSEYLKLIMNPWHWLIIGALLLCVPALVIFLNNEPDQLTLQFVLEQLLQSLYLGQAGFVSLAVLFIGQEFTGSSLRTSFLTCPNRLKFIICKLAIVLCMEIVLLVAVISLCILIAQG